MNLKFAVNDYVLIWNLLFQPSISESLHKLKEKLWLNYKKEYNDVYKNKLNILKDVKNYIPNDDTIYNIMLDSNEYQKIKTKSEKYRLELIQIWDKKISKELKNIIKKELPQYTVYCLIEQLDMIDTPISSSQKLNTIIIGKKIDKKEPLKVVNDIIISILNSELREYADDDKIIAEAIIEMAITNELNTRITGISNYFSGDSKYLNIKRQIYPYWLMYLGIPKDELSNYMKRDKIAFELEKYPYEKRIYNFDIIQFISFCIRNKKYIIR